MNLTTKAEIEKWLKHHKIDHYTINDDLTIDVSDSVFLSGKSLQNIPVQFNIVTGNFAINDNHLKTLEGCPRKINGNFLCFGNNLTNLIDGPEEVLGSYVCVDTGLSSLEGCPKEIIGFFAITNNPITTLEFLPDSVGGLFVDDLRHIYPTLPASPTFQDLKREQQKLLTAKERSTIAENAFKDVVIKEPQAKRTGI